MTSPLSQPEWKLLHQAMNQVDRQRGRMTKPDLARVKEVALATYHSQGIEVDEAMVDQALVELAGSQDNIHPPTRLMLDLEALRKAEQTGLARQRLAQVREHQQRLNGDPLARMRLFHQQKEAPYLAHRPCDDQALLGRLDGFLARMARQLRKQRATVWAGRVVGAAGAGLLSWMAATGLGVLPAATSFGWGLLLGWSGMMAGILGFGIARMTHTQWLKDCVQAMAAVRARQALLDKRYRDKDLLKGLSAAGVLAVGELTPLDGEALRAATRRIEAIDGVDVQPLRDAWKGWVASGAPLRRNDLAVVESWAKVRASHPFRAARMLARTMRLRQNIG